MSPKLDQELAKPVIDRFQSLGYSVSTSPTSGAEAVLTLWSDRACQSPQIHALSARALDDKKLAQATLDGVPPPRPFDALTCPNLSGPRAEFGPLEDAVARIVSGREPPPPLREMRFSGLATPAVLGAPKLVLTASTAALASFAGALTAVQNDAISVSQLQVALGGVITVATLCAVLVGYRIWSIRRSGD